MAVSTRETGRAQWAALELTALHITLIGAKFAHMSFPRTLMNSKWVESFSISGIGANCRRKLTPFVTKQMAPTKSKYSKNIEKQDREVTIPRNLEAEDYLNIWAIENARESLRVERKPKLLGQAMDAFTKTKAQAKSKKHKSRAIAQAKLRALSKARSEA